MADDRLDDLSYEKSEARWRDRLTEPECFTYVAEGDDGSIVGYAHAGPERDGDPLYRGELYAIYVMKAHQGSGIGRQLVNAVAQRLVANGVNAMLIWVLSRNPSRLFYERIGGRRLRTKMISIGGRELEETAYGWELNQDD